MPSASSSYGSEDRVATGTSESKAANGPQKVFATDPDELRETVSYLQRIDLPVMFEEVLRRVLEARPDNPLLAAYELQSAAVDYYNERIDDDGGANDEASDRTGEQSPFDAPLIGYPSPTDLPGTPKSSKATDATPAKKREQESLLCGMRKGNLEGTGASGKVFKAMDKGGTVYAVKAITLPKMDTGARQAAMDEYATLKCLTHRNIVRVWDFLAGEGRCEIVMSYWTQGSVATQIREFGALPPFTVRKYAVQILRGLGYLHCCRVLHRDIKPQNVLVDATGCVALTDFGLCSVSEAVVSGPRETATPKGEEAKELQIFGTWPYMSPGIARFNRYTEQSDLWAFACSLLEMATAHMPWSGTGAGVPQTWTNYTYCMALLTASNTGISPIDKRDGWEGPPWPQPAMKATLELSEDLLDFLRLAFSGEQQLVRMWTDQDDDDVTITHRHLVAHHFLGDVRHAKSRHSRRVAASRRAAAAAGADGLIRFDKIVPLSGNATVFISHDNHSNQLAVVDSLVLGDSPVAHTSPFSGMDIRRANDPKNKRGFNNLDLGRSYCARKRPAHVLLALLGRTQDRDDIEPGMPNITLEPSLLSRTDDTTEIVVDAESMDRVAAQERMQGLGVDDIDRWDPDTDGPPALEVYGPGRFSITIGEIKHLARSVFLHTTSDVPQKFLGDLIALTSRRDQQLFWSAHRAIPLAKVGEPEEEVRLQVLVKDDIERASASMRELSARREALNPSACPPEKRQELDQLDLALMKQRHHMQRGQAFLEVLLPCRTDRRRQSPVGQAKPFLEGFYDFQAWRQHVTLFPFEYGFPSAADGKAALEMSLTELCTAACVSQLGYLLVDGCDGNHNQLIERTPHPIVILSAAGLDFNKPLATLREASKYFARPDLSDDTPAHQGWRGMLPLAEFRLKERLKELYKCIFECAQHHGARNLSMLPMGLGVFLSNVCAEDKNVVRKAYFGAQFEILCELDFGFETYYINAGSPEQRGLAEQTLEEWLSGSETGTPMSLRCNVVLHCCDAKFLAVEMAKRSMAPAILDPSDCASMMLGLIGTFWEHGRGAHYSGEEDVCAHSTAVLARVGISDVWTKGATQSSGR